MKREDILQNNKLIAEFDGWYCLNEYARNEKHGSSMLYDDMQYHSSFEWLMPVVDKISKVIINGIAPFNTDQYVRVEIVPNGYVKISELRDTPIFSNVSVEGSLISAIYKAVVEFIKWNNEK